MGIGYLPTYLFKEISFSDVGMLFKVPENGRTKKENGEEKENETGTVKETVLREAVREKLCDLREDLLRDMRLQLDPDTLLERLWGRAQVRADTWLMEDKTNKP